MFVHVMWRACDVACTWYGVHVLWRACGMTWAWYRVMWCGM